MRHLFLCLLLPCVMLADPASKRAKVDELLVAMKSDAMMAQMLDQARSTIRGQAAKADVPAQMRPVVDEYTQKMIDVVSQHLNWSRLKPQIVAIYSEAFTEEELNAILTFYQSPAGRSLVDKMPQLVNRSVEVSQRELETAQPEIQKLSDEMLAKLKSQARK